MFQKLFEITLGYKICSWCNLPGKKTSLEFTATNTQMTTIWRQAKEKGSALIVYISSTARFESGVTAGGAALFCIPTPTTAKGPVPFTFLWISQIPRGSLFGGFRFLWPFDLPRSLWFLGCSFALRLSLWLSLWLASNLGLGGGRGWPTFLALPFLGNCVSQSCLLLRCDKVVLVLFVLWCFLGMVVVWLIIQNCSICENLKWGDECQKSPFDFCSNKTLNHLKGEIHHLVCQPQTPLSQGILAQTSAWYLPDVWGCCPKVYSKKIVLNNQKPRWKMSKKTCYIKLLYIYTIGLVHWNTCRMNGTLTLLRWGVLDGDAFTWQMVSRGNENWTHGLNGRPVDGEKKMATAWTNIKIE